MGCDFDDIEFLNGAPRCPEGHDVSRLQSKDLDQCMSQFYVFDGRLYAATNRGRFQSKEAKSETRTSSVVRGRLCITHERMYEADTRTATFVAYSQCDACKPVYYLSTRGVSFRSDGPLAEARPWQEFRIEVRKGVIRSIGTDGCETRDDVRKRLLESCPADHVLADDDKLVGAYKEIETRKKAVEARADAGTGSKPPAGRRR